MREQPRQDDLAGSGDGQKWIMKANFSRAAFFLESQMSTVYPCPVFSVTDLLRGAGRPGTP